MDVLLRILKNGKHFDDQKVNYILTFIEYQHRGMPHAHIAAQLNNIPKEDDIQECI